MLVEETTDDPFQLLALGAAATNTIGLGTSVAMAFPRSPTVTAMSAWSLQKLSHGRFVLGLGTQARAHVERRYGLGWHAPAPWMRDYVRALRAVWECWQTDTPLHREGPHYRLDLMVPLFDPGPIDHPNIPVHVAAVGPNMCAVAGEVADGVRLHPVFNTRYIDEIVIPALALGASRVGREPWSSAMPLGSIASSSRYRCETMMTQRHSERYSAISVREWHHADGASSASPPRPLADHAGSIDRHVMVTSFGPSTSHKTAAR